MFVRPLLVLILVAILQIGLLRSVKAEMKFDFAITDDGSRILFVIGRFDYDDNLVAFTNAVTSNRPDVVTFDSGGGNPSAAMRYGRRIRALGLDTVQVRQFDCMSACALAFMGGVNRTAEPGSIGVHQTYFETQNELNGANAVAAIQSHTAEVIAFMTEMGVSPEILQLSLSVGSDDIRFLTGREMERYGVIGSAEIDLSSSVTRYAGIPAREPGLRPAPTQRQTAQPSSHVESARRFIVAYHYAWSGENNGAMRFVSGAYDNFVAYYGNTIPVSKVLEDKRKFTRRWPQRLYEINEDTLNIRCNQLCSIEANVIWFASSRARNATSSGVASISVLWNPISGRISSETGKVLSIDRKSGNPTHMIQLWHQENETCRGGSYEAITAVGGACDRRSKIDTQLSTIGWCYGRQGELGYQHQWHRCGAGSIR